MGELEILSLVLHLVSWCDQLWNHMRICFIFYIHDINISVLYWAHLRMKCSLGISNFLKRSLVFPILLFSSISLHWSLRKAFLSLLAILWNSAFRCLYLSFSPLLFTSLLFTAVCKGSSDSHFAFLHFFSMGMILIPVSCTVLRTSIHSSSGTLSVLVR